MSGREPRTEEKAQCFLILKFRHVEAEQLSFAENMIGCHDQRFCFPNARRPEEQEAASWT